MSLDTIDKIDRCSDELWDHLKQVPIPLELAAAVAAILRAIPKLVTDAKEEHATDRQHLLDIIEGLLANWPHTEVADYLNPSDLRPVLMKDAALGQAARAIRFHRNPV